MHKKVGIAVKLSLHFPIVWDAPLTKQGLLLELNRIISKYPVTFAPLWIV